MPLPGLARERSRGARAAPRGRPGPGAQPGPLRPSLLRCFCRGPRVSKADVRRLAGCGEVRWGRCFPGPAMAEASGRQRLLLRAIPGRVWGRCPSSGRRSDHRGGAGRRRMVGKSRKTWARERSTPAFSLPGALSEGVGGGLRAAWCTVAPSGHQLIKKWICLAV